MTVTRLNFVLTAVCASVVASLMPSWNTHALDPLVFPYGGPALINGTKWTRLYYGTHEVGMYAMSPMISYFSKGYGFLASWKVAPWNEDQAGQLIRFAQSQDGDTWVNVSVQGNVLSAPGVLFPRMNSSQNPGVHLFAEPSLFINGRAYAAASPTQICLYPDQYQGTLLLRRVFPGVGNFGPLFWASNNVPAGFEEASLRENVTGLASQDATTRADIAQLTPRMTAKPCDLSVSTKCEFCVGGCQEWRVALAVKYMENERTHWSVNSTGGDFLLYRNYMRNHTLPNYYYASYRAFVGDNWSVPLKTNITSDVSNLNAGQLPDGRTYLVANFMVNLIRDPLFIALSLDGVRFTSVAALGSCDAPFFRNPGQPLGCLQRHNGNGVQGGLQYPQSIAVTDALAKGFYTILSQNKEDIWIAKTPLDSFDY